MCDTIPNIDTSNLVSFLQELNTTYNLHFVDIKVKIFSGDVSIPTKNILALFPFNSSLLETDSYSTKVESLSIRLRSKNINDLIHVLQTGVTPEFDLSKTQSLDMPSQLFFDSACLVYIISDFIFLTIKVTKYEIVIEQNIDSKLFPLFSLAEKYEIPIKQDKFLNTY